MCNFIEFSILLALHNINCITFASLDTSLENPKQQTAILNAFGGCNIRVMNFKGLSIDFKIAKQPFILIRYLTHCKTDNTYPYELGSTYSDLESQNSSSCSKGNNTQVNLPPDQVASNYVWETRTESFQLTSKNNVCEANVYLEPPTQQDSPQMYMYRYILGKSLKRSRCNISWNFLAGSKGKNDIFKYSSNRLTTHL